MKSADRWAGEIMACMIKAAGRYVFTIKAAGRGTSRIGTAGRSAGRI
jgi:hypothetical protein